MEKIFFSAVMCFCISAVSAFTVIVPEKADSVTMNAAKELQYHLGKVLNKTIPSAVEGRSAGGRKIYLGNTRYARKNGIDFSKYQMEESLIRSYGKDIVIGGGRPRGTLYGAYEFLERFAGIVWLDPFTTTIPRKKTLDLPEKINLRFAPSFRFRGVYSVTNTNLDKKTALAYLRFRSRMRENIFWAEKLKPEEIAQWGVTPVLGSPAPLNTLYFYTREWPDKGFDECFSLDKSGKRLRPLSKRGPGHICFSSVKARQKFAEQMKQYIAADRKKYPEFPPVLYNLSINDCDTGNCVCEGCRALTRKYGASSGAMLEFVNFVYDEVRKTYPDVKIQTSAYYFTAKAPEGICPRENVFIRFSPIDVTFRGECYTMKSLEDPLNRSSLEEMKRWSRISKLQIWSYWVNYGNHISNGGIVNAETIWKNIRLFKQHNANYIFSEAETPHLTSFHSLRLFIGYQMKKNAGQSFETLMNKFFCGYYGKAAQPMRRLYDYIALRQKEHPHLSIRAASQLAYLDRNFFKTTARFLSEAEKLAGKDRELLERILLEKNVIDLARLDIRDDWKAEPGLPPAEIVSKRVAENTVITTRRFFGKRSSFFINDVAFVTSQVKRGTVLPVPENVKKEDVYDLTVSLFSGLRDQKRYGIQKEKDPDSVTGEALVLRKAGKPYPHLREFTSGVQSRSLKKSLIKRKFTGFGDEKYHFYHLGRVNLTHQSLLWLHQSWRIQQNLDRFFRAGRSNIYDIYLSVKLEGPEYSPGSKKENAMFLDRILLISAE